MAFAGLVTPVSDDDYRPPKTESWRNESWQPPRPVGVMLKYLWEEQYPRPTLHQLEQRKSDVEAALQRYKGIDGHRQSRAAWEMEIEQLKKRITVAHTQAELDRAQFERSVRRGDTVKFKPPADIMRTAHRGYRAFVHAHDGREAHVVEVLKPEGHKPRVVVEFFDRFGNAMPDVSIQLAHVSP